VQAHATRRPATPLTVRLDVSLTVARRDPRAHRELATYPQTHLSMGVAAQLQPWFVRKVTPRVRSEVPFVPP
jgi:hypothetical protein